MYKFRMEDEGLLDLHDNVIVKETQDTPNTFSNNLIQKLGICRNLSSGTEAVSSNNPNYNHLNVCIQGRIQDGAFGANAPSALHNK